MSQLFEERDSCMTPLGALSLRLRRELKPGGIFGLCSSDPAHAFAQARAKPVSFHNPLTGRPFARSAHPARNGERDRA